MKKKTENNEPTFSKIIIMGKLKKKDYCFNKSIYEASDPTPIPLEKQKISYLTDYLDTHYGTGTKPTNSEQILKKIFDNKKIENITQADKSEYLKILALCAILSKLKKGWYNLLICEDENSPKLSAEANWTYNKSSEIKIKHDEIINCFYSQLSHGLPDNEENSYIKGLLTCKSDNPNDPGKSLFNIVKHIEDSIYTLFNFYEKQQRSINQSKRSEDTISFADKTTRNHLNNFLNTEDLNDFQDGLRLSLMKFAGLNQVTNDINADLRLHKEINESFPTKNVLTLIKTFRDTSHLNRPLNADKIIKSIEDIYYPPHDRIKSPPKDLITCANFIYRLFVLVEPQKLNIELDPPIEYIGLAAMLLYDHFIMCSKADLGIQGETNRHILIYKNVSDFLKTTPLDQIKQLDDIASKIPYTILFYLCFQYELALALLHGDGIEYIGKELDLKSHYARTKVVKDNLKLLKEYNSLVLINFASNLKNTLNEIYNTSD